MGGESGIAASTRERVRHFQRSGRQDDAHSRLQPVYRDDAGLMERGTNKYAGKLGQRSARDANGIARPEIRAMEAVHREWLDQWPLSRQETNKPTWRNTRRSPTASAY